MQLGQQGLGTEGGAVGGTGPPGLYPCAAAQGMWAQRLLASGWGGGPRLGGAGVQCLQHQLPEVGKGSW